VQAAKAILLNRLLFVLLIIACCSSTAVSKGEDKYFVVSFSTSADRPLRRTLVRLVILFSF
jgi:hypothetical protein